MECEQQLGLLQSIVSILHPGDNYWAIIVGDNNIGYDRCEYPTQYNELDMAYANIKKEAALTSRFSKSGDIEYSLLIFENPDVGSKNFGVLVRYFANTTMLFLRNEVPRKDIIQLFLKRSWFLPYPFDLKLWEKYLFVGISFEKEHSYLEIDIPDTLEWDERVAKLLS
jgi:hypothetical protein